MLDPQVLDDLKARCLQAQSLGFEIARAEWYASELGGGEGEIEGVTKNSPAHLLALIAKAEGKKPEATKAKKKSEKDDPEAAAADAEAKSALEDASKDAPKEPASDVKSAKEKEVSVSETLSATASVEAPAEVVEAHKGKEPSKEASKGKKS